MRKELGIIGRRVRALHRDEGGAEMLEYILIVAVVALPLVGVLIWFRKEVTIWLQELWETISGEGEYETPG